MIYRLSLRVLVVVLPIPLETDVLRGTLELVATNSADP